MSAPRDTLLRQLTLLQLIPRFPGRADTSTLVEKLFDRGFKVDQRTIQRDLKDRLSILFPIICDDSELPYRWSFDKDANFNLPYLDTPTSLALYLAETQLRSLLPQSVADQLRPLFNAAKQHLDALQHNQLANWTNMVRTLPNGKALIPAPIDEEVWRNVTQAMLEKKQLLVEYRSRAQNKVRQYLLHPIGLVSRYSISYIVAIVDGYDNYRQFALHRMQSTKLTDQASLSAEDFDIDAYINQGAFGFMNEKTESTVKLVADISPSTTWVLSETPLSEQQSIAAIEGSDWSHLEAIVPNNQEMLWWIYAMNTGIRVHEPQSWVDEIKRNISCLTSLYELDAI